MRTRKLGFYKISSSTINRTRSRNRNNNNNNNGNIHSTTNIFHKQQKI